MVIEQFIEYSQLFQDNQKKNTLLHIHLVPKQKIKIFKHFDHPLNMDHEILCS